MARGPRSEPGGPDPARQEDEIRETQSKAESEHEPPILLGGFRSLILRGPDLHGTVPRQFYSAISLQIEAIFWTEIRGDSAWFRH